MLWSSRSIFLLLLRGWVWYVGSDGRCKVGVPFFVLSIIRHNDIFNGVDEVPGFKTSRSNNTSLDGRCRCTTVRTRLTDNFVKFLLTRRTYTCRCDMSTWLAGDKRSAECKAASTKIRRLHHPYNTKAWWSLATFDPPNSRSSQDLSRMKISCTAPTQ